MLEQLLTICAGEDRNGYEPYSRLESVQFSGDDAELIIAIRVCPERDVRFEVTARKLRDYRIAEAHGTVSLDSDYHVLARQVTAPRQELYFRGTPLSPHETVGRLLEAHREVVQGFIPFDRFFNINQTPAELLAEGAGLLADGPEFVMERYAEVLAAEGVRPGPVCPRPAVVWDGEEHVPITGPLATLMLGEAWFVAEAFEERRG